MLSLWLPRGRGPDLGLHCFCVVPGPENGSDLAAMARAELSGAEHACAQGESWGWLRASSSPAPLEGRGCSCIPHEPKAMGTAWPYSCPAELLTGAPRPCPNLPVHA